jgi:hypothetical protein
MKERRGSRRRKGQKDGKLENWKTAQEKRNGNRWRPLLPCFANLEIGRRESKASKAGRRIISVLLE